MSYAQDEKAAVRAWGAEHGLRGRSGGWIYNDAGYAVTQGWGSVFYTHRRRILDWLTVKLTAFDTFEQMVERTGPTYRPTILPTNALYRFLADQYDLAQRGRGDPRRAYRGRESR